MAYAYSLALWKDINQAIADRMAGGTGNPAANLRNAAGTVLATVVLDKTAMTVNAGTGELTMGVLTQEDSALVSGTADNLLLKDGDGTSVISLPCQQGVDPVAGKFVMNTTSIIAGIPFSITSLSFPAGTTL